mmetsp:Transcript_16042/g.34739  ORF Transcript_16042/g.34739 Transcript_16042/m.34739 type:complete len:237 (+) Transcript_16042:351-1061(+)
MRDRYRERRRKEEAEIEVRAEEHDLRRRSSVSDALNEQHREHARPTVRTVDDVIEWLTAVGYPDYIETFRVNEVNGEILRTLSSEELRDDLGVQNLKHRRDILDGINELVRETASVQRDALPEHGRILDHLSNVRTYHSWLRIGIQLLSFSVATLRLTPVYRGKELTTASSLTFALFGLSVFVYGAIRYRMVINMIERSSASERWYRPDYIGIIGVFTGMLCIAALVLTLILINGF